MLKRVFDIGLSRGTAVKATLLTNTAQLLAENAVAVSGTWQTGREVDDHTTTNGTLRVTVCE